MDQRPKRKAGYYKILEENTGRRLSDIDHSKIFLDPPPRVIKIKTKTNRREPTEWKNIFANQATDKGLTSKINKEQLSINKTNNPIKNGWKI